MAADMDNAPGELTPAVARNIEALARRRQDDEATTGLHQRVPQLVAGLAGSMAFVYVHIAAYAAWAAVNLGWVPGITPFDPHFSFLGVEASVEAIFLSAFVLMSQNRGAALADRRADLALHINLLTEDELTKLTDVVTAIADKLDVQIAGDHGIHDVKREVTADAVLDAIDARQGAAGASAPRR